MAVTRVQYGSASLTYNGTTTFTSLAVTLPAAATAGNLLIAAWINDKSSGAFTTPSGWTLVESLPGASVSFHVVYKIAAGGETSVTGTWATAMFGGSAYIIEYSGVDTTTPLGPNGLPAYSDTARTTQAFAPATPTANGIGLILLGIDTVATTFAPTATGYTQVGATISGGAAGSGAPGFAFLEHATVSGTANSPTVTWTDSDQVNGALLQINQASATVAFSASPALAGAGALTSTATLTTAASPALTGSGALTASGVNSTVQAFSASPALSGSGALSSTATSSQGGGVTPVTFVSGAANALVGTVGAGVSVTVTAPASIVAGNLLVAVVYDACIVATTMSGPAGWTLVSQSTAGTPTVGVAAVFWKVATGSEPANYAFTSTFGSSATHYLAASVLQYSGANTTTPFSAVPAYSTISTSTTTPNTPSVTPTAANGMDIVGWGSFNGVSNTAFPGGFTNRASQIAANNDALYVGDATRAAAANVATGTRVFTQSSTDTGIGVHMMIADGTSGSPAYSAAPALTGAGALSASVSPKAVAAPALTGSGALSASGVAATQTFTGSPALTGSGALTATGVKAIAGPAPVLNSRVVGIPGTTTAVVSVNVTNTTSARLMTATDAAMTQNVVYGSPVTPNAQGDAILRVSGLTTSTRQFYYRVAMTDSGTVEHLDTASLQGKFKTAPTGAASFAFNFGSCTSATDSASMAAIAARGDDLFFHLGDLYYNDGASQAASQFRTEFQNKFTATNHAAMLPITASAYTPSDHDGMANNTSAGDSPTAWSTWNQVYREKWPTDSTIPATTGAYFTFVWGRIRFIQIDDRSFKTIDSATDNASKTALGATQKQWLKDTVTASTEQAIIILNSSPWTASSSDGETGWADYLTERNELANFFSASGKKMFILGGDMHAVAASNAAGSPGGVINLQAAPFNNSGSQKGGPWTVGPYPSDTSTVQQYGHVAIVDDGVNPVQVNFTGLSSDNTVRVTLNTTLPATNTYTASPALTGTGALTSSASTRIVASGTAGLTGTGVLSSSVGQGLSSSVNLTGSGALSATTKFAASASPALTGSGALTSTASSSQANASSPTLVGSGALTANGVTKFSVTTALTGAGALTAATVTAKSGTATLTGAGALTASGAVSLIPTFSATVGLTGSGALTSTAAIGNTPIAVALRGNGSLSAYGTGSINNVVGSSTSTSVPVRTKTKSIIGTAIQGLTGYSVVEDATPLDVADTSAGVGSIGFATNETPDSMLLYGCLIELEDDKNRGTTSGVITDVSITSGIVTLAADNRLGSMVGIVTANPRTGTFESVARYYLRLGHIEDGVYFDPRIAHINVTTQGWNDDVWLKLKQLCIANRIEIALVSNMIVFRPIRSFLSNITKQTAFTTDIQKTPAASTIEIGYYNNEWVDAEVIYPRTVDELAAAQIFQVPAKGVVEADIQLTASLSHVLQPVCVDDVAVDYDGSQSVYSVRAIDNSPVSPGDWVSLGGNIELTINPNTTSLHIKITGCSDQYRGPYRIAGRHFDPAVDPTTVVIGIGQPGGNSSITDYGVGTASQTTAQTVTTTVTTTTAYAPAKDDYPWPRGTYNALSVLGYGTRSCTDFVMWRMNRDANHTRAPWKYTWHNVRKTNGNAIGWKNDWRTNGWAVDIQPIPGCIAWFGTSAGALGHVAYVQAVGPDYVVLEDYNWGAPKGHYHKHTMKTHLVDSFLQNPGGSTKKVTTHKTTTAHKTTPTKRPTNIAGYSGVQLTNAAEIMRAARDENFGTNLQHAQYLGVAAAMGESTLRVLAYGDKAGPDSRGLFQQRTSWGSLATRMNPYESAKLFYNALKNVTNWQNIKPTAAIHAVQGNLDPNYYTVFYNPAKSVVNAINKGENGTTSKSVQTTTQAKAPAYGPAAANAETIKDATTEVDYNSLRIVGTGTIFNKQALVLPTGAAGPTGVGPTVGATAENIHVATLEEAYTCGVYVAQHYVGETQTISGTLTTIERADDGSGALLWPTIADFDQEYKGMTIAQFNAANAGKKIADFDAVQKAKIDVSIIPNQVFGNVAGARFKHGAAYYRITTATTTESSISFSAVRDTMIGDFNAAHAGKTIADFNAEFRGMNIAQFNRVALQGG